MLSALSASIEMTARITVLPAGWGQDSSLMLIKPRASGALARPASSVRSTSDHLSTSTVEQATTPDIARTVPTLGQIPPCEHFQPALERLAVVRRRLTTVLASCLGAGSAVVGTAQAVGAQTSRLAPVSRMRNWWT
jgi:hypothetical protein